MAVCELQKPGNKACKYETNYCVQYCAHCTGLYAVFKASKRLVAKVLFAVPYLRYSIRISLSLRVLYAVYEVYAVYIYIYSIYNIYIYVYNERDRERERERNIYI